jgi:hypothetical protein
MTTITTTTPRPSKRTAGSATVTAGLTHHHPTSNASTTAPTAHDHRPTAPGADYRGVPLATDPPTRRPTPPAFREKKFGAAA